MSVSAPVVDYVAEEVRRQGHDLSMLDGIERVGWMLNAWAYALGGSESKYFAHWPNVDVAILLGQMIEPRKNERGLRACAVRVGSRLCPDFERVPFLLETLFQQRSVLAPLEFYKEFEMIHPFVDGNGRTGKILLNWLGGTLLSPIFPPSDLFGEAIRNP